MIDKKISLDSLIEDIKIANDYNDTYMSENDFMSDKIVEIDGYSISLSFRRRRNLNSINETLKISAEDHTFLPFNLVTKLAKKFLGQYELIYCEAQSPTLQKVYLWTVNLDLAGRPIQTITKNPMIPCNYDDFYFTQVIPINFS